jgi:hypothetical protein
MPRAMKPAAILISTIVLVGCRTESEPYKFSGGDGSTREHAVVIKAPDVGIGIAAQMVWMKDNYSGWSEVTNDYQRVGSKLYYSVLAARAGQTNRVYFDYTDFASKDERQK